MDNRMILLIAVAGVAIMLITVLFLATRYKRCPSDKILVVYGKVGAGQSARCVHGGGAFIWPLIQDFTYMSLTPMSIAIPLQKALSLQNIRINVPSTFTVGVSTEDAIMYNAAERLLNLAPDDVESMAKEIIFGQLRLTVASLTIEQINQDREKFLEAIRRNVAPELNKVGLYLINVNITDITDESGYIDSIGKKAASEALNQAKIDVAEQEKKGTIGEADATRERTIKVAQNVAESQKGEKQADASKRVYVQEQEAQAINGENKSRADIAASNAELAVRQAEAQQRGEVARLSAQAEIRKAQAIAEQERLIAEEVVRQEIEKRKVEIAAEAEAERIRREAKGEADAILLKYEAEARGIRMVLDAKASGYEGLVRSANDDARAAATLLLTEKIEEIVKLQVEAIKNIKIDKITVWDSAAGNGDGTSTSHFLSGLVKSLPPLHDVAQMAGLELPKFLGDTKTAVADGAGQAVVAPRT
jgi:flotillin